MAGCYIFTMDFEALISPVSVPDFFTRFHGKSTLVLHREDPGYYGDLLSLADVDRCLRLAALSRTTALEVVTPPGSGRPTRTLRGTEISRDRLYEAHLAGDTLQLFEVEKVWPPVTLLAAEIQEALHAAVGVNFFLTPPHSQGCDMHFDLVDVMVLQLAGSKRWTLWEPTYEAPTETALLRQKRNDLMEKDESKLTLREELLLEPGDFFYLPRGYYHKAMAGGEISLHLSFGIRPLYWMDFFHRAFELAALDDVDLRGDLPPGFTHDPKAQQVMAEKFAALMKRFREKASFDATLRSISEEWVGAQPLPADGHFAALSTVSELNQDSVVERRSGLICLVEASESTAAIKFGPNRVQGPAAIGPSLEFVRDNRRFRIADLPGALSADSKVVLVRRLVREGLLRPGTGGVGT